MRIGIDVTIGVTDTLGRILLGMLKGGEPQRPASTAEPETPEAPAQPAELTQPETPEAPALPAKTAQPETPAEPAQPETPAEPAQPEEPAEEEPKYPTDDEMKTLMDVAISELASTPDWRDSTDPEVLRIVKSCPKVFKAIAKYLGAEKPLRLQGEERVKFLAELKRVVKTDGGVDWLPF